MKKLVLIGFTILLILSVTLGALAQDDPLNYCFPTGTEVSFGSMKGTLPTYTAPALSAYRMAGGKAAAGLHYQIITFYASSDDWALISYENSSHVIHMGWADTTSLSYAAIKMIPSKDPIPCAFMNASLSDATPFWDYYDIYQDPVTTLSSGTKVIYLCYMQDDLSGKLAYIQVDSPLGLMRGFVPYKLLVFE
jgi:hypothetical protein